MALEFKSLTMMDLRSTPGKVLDRVHSHNEAFVIERNGQQMACLVPVSAFLPDIRRSRLNEELDKLHQRGERPRTTISEERQIEMRFQEATGREKITVKIVLPHGYPNTAPKIYASPIAKNAPHRWQDGALCIFGAMTSWNPGKHNVIFALELTRKWLQEYQQWRGTGRWAGASESDG